MKNILKIFVAVFLFIGSSSCTDYLNVDHLLEDRRDLQDVFESRDYSIQWLAGVYSHLKGVNADVSSKGHNPFNFISDDMLYFDRTKLNDGGRSCAMFKMGGYNENYPGQEQDSWRNCYKGIRDASIFIHNIDINREMTPGEILDKKAQARFLRAYYYWLLLRKYGPIPMMPDEGVDFNLDYAELATPRSTYEECVDFITSELALAAQDLAIERTNREIACPTRGAALAARAKVYLYGASPLFNGNDDDFARQLVDHEGRRLISPEYKEVNWAKAAAAAKDVIELNRYELYWVPKREDNLGNMRSTTNPAPNGSAINFDYYRYPKTIAPPESDEHDHANQDFPKGWRNIDPCESYRQLFNGEVSAYANPELIFTRGVNQLGEGVEAMSLHQMPRSLGGWNAHGLTLKMYDAYYMNDGKEFDTINRPIGYTVNNNRSEDDYRNFLPLPPGVSMQNANREPRFYASVAYNGSIWENEEAPVGDNTRYKQVFYYRDGQDGKDASGFFLRTGIGVKKYYHPVDTHFGGVSIFRVKSEPAIRYAEVLLIYAEALNELTHDHSIPSYDGQRTYTVGRDKAEISSALTPVRVRAGLPDYKDDVYADADAFRAKLKKEWQIEFMGEGHRYYDLRRWKDAPKEESDIIKGFNMNMTSTQKDVWHQPVEVTFIPAVFSDKMYLWPISHSELKKNRKLTQNPGWTTFEE